MSEVDIMNRIIEGIERRDKSISFAGFLKSNKNNAVRLMGFYINKMAIAGLHILGIETYEGNDTDILETIKAFSL